MHNLTYMVLIGTKFGYKFRYSLKLQFSLKKINIITYFKNIIVELYVIFVLNTHVKFRVNRMLFIILFINLFLCMILSCKNLKFKHLINNIAINYIFYENFASMEDIKRKCNLMVDL